MSDVIVLLVVFLWISFIWSFRLLLCFFFLGFYYWLNNNGLGLYKNGNIIIDGLLMNLSIELLVDFFVLEIVLFFIFLILICVL